MQLLIFLLIFTYTEKKEWTRKMKKIVMLSIIIIIAVSMMLCMNGKEYKQQQIESELPEKSKETERIRVLIKTNGFKHITHSEVKMSAENGLILTSAEGSETIKGEICIKPSDKRFQKGTIKVESNSDKNRIQILSLSRGYGTPEYRGKFELFQTAEGIVIVNELPIEEYLYAVVPSEMPSSYAIEALKVQAVCARSYAYNQSRNYEYPAYKAHVDDSTSFQVYGNSKEQKTTNDAVDQTKGEKLWYNKKVATTYYYSTSCGKSTGIEAWGTKKNSKNGYLVSVNICDELGRAYERDLPWYQWTAKIPEETLENLIELNTGTELGKIRTIKITKKGEGGIVQQIVVQGDTGKITVETENKIRRTLGGKGYQIEKQDGTIIDSTQLLPSAFFEISKTNGMYVIEGGGYGHGIGMSQNGANEMAKAGKNYRDILYFFYPGTEVK